MFPLEEERQFNPYIIVHLLSLFTLYHCSPYIIVHLISLTLPHVDSKKVIPGHQAAYLPDVHLAHRSLRIKNMDPTVSGHETAAGIPHAVPTSNSGHRVAGQGTQHHGD